MQIRPIRTAADYEAAIARIAELDVLATLVEAYERIQFPIEPADPIAAINFRLEQLGRKRKDLEPWIASPCSRSLESTSWTVLREDSTIA